MVNSVNRFSACLEREGVADLVIDIGGGIIVSSGLFALQRERKVKSH